MNSNSLCYKPPDLLFTSSELAQAQGTSYMYVPTFTFEAMALLFNPFSTRPHQNVVWYNNSWLGFLKILNYVPKEREIFSAQNEPSFVTIKCYDGS